RPRPCGRGGRRSSSRASGRPAPRAGRGSCRHRSARRAGGKRAARAPGGRETFRGESSVFVRVPLDAAANRRKTPGTKEPFMQPSLSVLTLTALCFALAVPAQEDPELAMPEPAPELKKLEPLIGHWQGSGTARMGPGEPTPWEAHSSYAWALGGFFVQEDTVVRFEG